MRGALLKILQSFVGNILSLLRFVRKIPIHGTRYKTCFSIAGITPIMSGIIPIDIGIISISVKLHSAACEACSS